MLGTSALSLPAPFAHEHRPLRMTTESSRPQPTGACNFLMVHPSAKSKICACQVYHHDRAVSGNVCDCGHAACYHVHSFGDKPADGLQSPKVDLVEKVKRLEDILIAEREARESDHAEWKREAKALHDALVPFYRTEDEVQRKVAQLDTTLTTLMHDQKHLEDRLQAMNERAIWHHHRADATPSAQHTNGLFHTRAPLAGDDVPGLTSSDERSSASSFSRHHTPSEAVHSIVEPESPRSSGILNLVSKPRSSITSTTLEMARSGPLAQEEPRSSGFLGVDMRSRYASNLVRKRQSSSPTSSSLTESTEHQTMGQSGKSKSPRYNAVHTYAGSSSRSMSSTISPPMRAMSRSLPQPSPSVSGYINADRIYQDGSRHHNLYGNSRQETYPSGPSRTYCEVPTMALDVLANLSTASNGTH